MTPFWKDPAVHHVGSLPPAAYLIPDLSAGEDRLSSPSLTLLSGKWRFCYYESAEDLPWEHLTSYLPDQITVPGTWQAQGYDQAQYITSPYPFLFDPPHVPAENPAGVYSRTFDYHPGVCTQLVFEGADSCLIVYVNGHFAGYAEGPHNRSVFDVSQLVLEGTNELTAVVLKWCSGSYLDDQDKLRLSGIFRDVYLLSRPETYLTDLFVKPDLKGAAIEAKIAHPCGQVVFTLLDSEGHIEAQQAMAAGEQVSCRLDVANPRLWSAETPYLYTLRVELGGEWIEQHVGLRTVEIIDHVYCINGRPVKLLGVNRHDNHPDTGCAVTTEDMRRDLLMMKAHNMNCVRTSHYPNDPRFYELCNELGIYVVDEADMETHGCSYIGDIDLLMNEPTYREAVLDREIRLVERDKNFPCVVMWSMGNESGWGKALEEGAQWMHRRDPSRPVHMQSAFTGMRKKDLAACLAEVGPEKLEVIAMMYPTIERLREFLASDPSGRPCFVSEYCHAMGNSLGGMAEYAREFWNTPSIIGGCIWEWADHALRAKDGTMRYGGDFGEPKHNGNLCADGLVSPDREPHSGLYEVKEAYTPVHLHYEDSCISIQNRWSFLTTKGVILRFTQQENGKTVWQQTLPAPEIAPGETGKLAIALPSERKGECVLVMEAIKDGLTLTESYAVLQETGFKPGAESRALNCCYRSGMLHRLEADGQTLVSGVVPCIWRAPLDNDRLIRQVWEEPKRGENINISSMTIRLQEAIDGGLHTCYAIGGMSYRPAVTGDIQWQQLSQGALRIRHEAAVREDYPSWLPRLGLMWTLSKRLHNVCWYGLGPGESYEDKHLAVRPGLWQYDALKRPAEYVRPQEHGSVWKAQFITLTDDQGKGLILCSDAPFTFNVQPWTPNQMTAAAHPEELPEPSALYLHTDLRMSGIGSASVGPELPEAYRILPGEHLAHTLYAAAFDENTDDPFAFFKQK